MWYNIILRMIINFIKSIIEGYMDIFIVYIGMIRPLFHFNYTSFKGSLVNKIINFNGI
jgi:hypothetical protein